MNKELFTYSRKSYMALNHIYFWTATINKWQNFLDFFASFCVKTKMKSKIDFIQKNLQVGVVF